MPEPLEGIKVVEMTIAVQGPSAGLYLRDMGAEVIKIEPPMGDASRYSRARQNETPDGTVGPQYVAANRGKRSICLDMSTATGAKALHALLRDADVFLTNYRRPAIEKMGLDYDSLKDQYPKLIHASVNGFGPLGADSDKAMLDGVAASRGGLVHQTGHADRESCLPGAIIIDTSGAMQLALGTMTAIVSRERHGLGQQVQTSALGTALWLQQWELTHVAMTGAQLERTGNHHPNIRGFYGVYRTKDDGEIMLAQVMDAEAWDALAIFAEAFELSLDPRFQTPGQRLGEGITEEDSVHLRGILREAFATKTTKEWVDFLYTQPEIIWERVRNWNEVLEDEQAHANNYFTRVEVPGVGETTTVGTVVTLSETPGSPKGNAPELGEANAELLSDAGLSTEEIEEIEATATKVREETLLELQKVAAAAANSQAE
ncbi:MAG: CoA transferase [Pseudomonadales bacterium]|nr:CoA transferase [Pseudomonadales bacterium]